MRTRTGLAALIVGAVLAAPAAAQNDPNGVDPSVTTIVASSFTPRGSQMGWEDDADGFRSGLTPGVAFRAGIPLPTGASVVGMVVEACDGDHTGMIAVQVFECGAPVNGASCSVVAAVSTGGPATPGCGRFDGGAEPAPFTIRSDYTYFVEVLDTDDTDSNRFRAVRFAWERPGGIAPEDGSAPTRR